MHRATMLREQAEFLRDMAAGSTADPEIHKRLLALARQCERLAEELGEPPSRAAGPPTKPH
jgi:hypothetical protein